MKFKFKILLYSTNHITGNLVFLKLRSYGHEVTQCESSGEVIGLLEKRGLDLLVCDGAVNVKEAFQGILSKNVIPVLFIGEKLSIDGDFNMTSMNLAFSEEDFLHKVSYLSEFQNSRTKLPFLESVIQHYAGDAELAQKVILSFLESWESSLEEIRKSFDLDEDKLLATRIHSFKGVLSALGDTEASTLLKKMEILLKGRSRERAHELFGQLHMTCRALVEELEASSLL